VTEDAINPQKKLPLKGFRLKRIIKDSSRKQVENKKACDSLRPQRCPAVADDGGLLATVGMEEQPVGPLRVRSEGKSRPGPADVRRQRPHDGVIASEAFGVVVVVHDGDFDRHAVEVDHAVDHVGGLGCSDTWGRGREGRGANRGTETPRVSNLCLYILMTYL